MSSQLKISADTSEVKKSILDIGKSVRDLKGSKVQVFSNEDKKFIKSEFKKEIVLMKTKLKENREEIKKMIAAQKELTAGSREELEHRKKILEAYKVQARLAKDLGSAQKDSKMGGGIDKAGSGGGVMGGIMGIARLIPGIAAVATIGYAMAKGMQANSMYKAGAGNRNKLKGLGVGDENFGSAQDLGRVGLTEDEMIQRRIDATSRLGRGAVSQEGEMRKAGFERSFGLQGGTMTGVSSQLRGSMGGQGANEATMKLQASVFAAGIEDAIGPYLESATQLLTDINENGTTQTSEITGLLAQLTKDGERTPELLSKTFSGINSSVKNATGEQSAFLQTAFAKAGIGGGSIGGTKFAMGSGGIMGQDRSSLEKRGYNKDLLDNMEKSGMFKGAGQRTGAIMDLMKSSGGLKSGEKVSDVKDVDRMAGLGNLASSTLGIKDPSQAFDALMMMEKVQNKQMTQKQFESKMKEMQEGKDPSLQRLDKINSSLSGQTELLQNINDNLMTALGKEAVQAGNQMTRTDNEGIVGVKNVGNAINSTGVTQKAGDISAGIGESMNSGGVGGRLYDRMFGMYDKGKFAQTTSDDSVVALAKKKRDQGTGFVGQTDAQIEEKVRKSLADSAKEIGKAIGAEIKQSPIVNKTTIQLPDGKVTEKTMGK